MAHCLKRASLTGGCYAIADIIHCRALQAEYSAGYKTVQELRERECEPCLILPFQSLPAGCADDITGNPSIQVVGGRIYELDDPIWTNFEAAYDRIHRVGEDFRYIASECRDVHNSADYAAHRNRLCRPLSVCLDPPRGQLTWAATHSSQLAIVNSSIVFTVHDVPLEFVEFPVAQYSPPLDGKPSSIGGNLRSYLSYPNPIPGDPLIRVWPRVDSSQQFSSVEQLVAGGECVLRTPPRFRIGIEELWPDSDEAEIRRCSGTIPLIGGMRCRLLSKRAGHQAVVPRTANRSSAMRSTAGGVAGPRRGQDTSKRPRLVHGS